ncbi:unnamed protein product [Mytilus coruscus]|uniref:Uncharacterized protein n=1 Tax=Mytilus coruscus TaxID=42192 RepID=A0A6J8DNC5_MYTCO|nr:unnamed protein product [Mytilus coruscus]
MKRQIERMERELKEKENVIQFMNNEQKIKDTDFSKSMHVAKEKLEKLEESVNTLKAKNKDLEEENDYVRNLIQDNNLLELYDETSNQFTRRSRSVEVWMRKIGCINRCTNRLLSSVYQDICNPLLVAGSRALGIISKIITGPLWRNIECKTHILDINDTLTALRSFLAEAKDDCSEVVTGKHLPFPEESCKIENDIVMAELFKPDETDVMTIQVLQALFSCMLNLLDRQAADHLPGGKYFSKPTDISAESKSVLKHNKLPEFFFGQLDFLLRYRPNASLLCNEAYLLYSHNKTDEWLQSLDDVTRIQLINDSRKEGKNIRLKFKESLKTIEEKRVETLKLKEKGNL